MTFQSVLYTKGKGDYAMKYTDEAFTAIMDKYGDMVLRICYVRLRNLFDAEDAFQEVFISLYKTSNKPDESYLKAWLIKTACNKCTSFLRSKKADAPLPDNASLSFTPYDNTVEQAILSLEKNQRTAIYLYYYESLSAKEIAEILKLNEGNIRVILHRARQELKELLKEDYFE